MSTLFPLPQTYFRVTGAYVSGRWVSAITGPFTFLGTVQPVTAKDVSPGEPGRQDLGDVKVYSSQALNPGEQGSTNKGDVIFWAGRYWEIMQEMPYKSMLIPHWKYIAELRPDFVPPAGGP